MECQEFEAELDGRLDERLDPRSPELQAHAKSCANCEERLQQAIVLLCGIVIWRQAAPAPSGDLTARIANHVRLADFETRSVGSDRTPVNQSKWQAWAVAAAAMAAIWLVFVGANFDHSGQADHRMAAVGQRPIGSPTRAPVTPVPATPTDLGTVLVSAEGAYSQLATETLEAAQDFALLWPTSQAVSNAAPSPAPHGPDTNWNQELSRELAPIGGSVTDALNFLWRAAPHVEKSAT